MDIIKRSTVRYAVLTTLCTAVLLGAIDTAQAKVDLVTLPARDTVQVTIYNSADMTLVRESRALTLKEGRNKLQFSWANTLIDPTSLEMLPKAHADAIRILDLTYPPRVRNLGVWNIDSRHSGKAPVEITYLTSGLFWRAFYMGTLTPDEQKMRLQGYVRVTNKSGEDYENAQTRLIVGKVHMLDEIAELAQRTYPYGSPMQPMKLGYQRARHAKDEFLEMEADTVMLSMSAPSAAKEIVKEGLSEYFLYTIEGTETIPNGWSKRLPSFDVDEIPVVNLYKYEEDRYGSQAVRFLSFKNDEAHHLGDTPIPGGILKVYRDTGDNGHLSYAGQSSFKYIPVEEDVELNLGAGDDVLVEPTLMKVETDKYLFNNHGDVRGWITKQVFEIEVKNTRDLPAKVEITRNFNTPHWDIENSGDYGEYEKVDLDTVRFTLELAPSETKTFRYLLTTRHGMQAE